MNYFENVAGSLGQNIFGKENLPTKVLGMNDGHRATRLKDLNKANRLDYCCPLADQRKYVIGLIEFIDLTLERVENLTSEEKKYHGDGILNFIGKSESFLVSLVAGTLLDLCESSGMIDVPEVWAIVVYIFESVFQSKKIDIPGVCLQILKQFYETNDFGFGSHKKILFASLQKYKMTAGLLSKFLITQQAWALVSPKTQKLLEARNFGFFKSILNISPDLNTLIDRPSKFALVKNFFQERINSELKPNGNFYKPNTAIDGYKRNQILSLKSDSVLNTQMVDKKSFWVKLRSNAMLGVSKGRIIFNLQVESAGDSSANTFIRISQNKKIIFFVNIDPALPKHLYIYLYNARTYKLLKRHKLFEFSAKNFNPENLKLSNDPTSNTEFFDFLSYIQNYTLTEESDPLYTAYQSLRYFVLENTIRMDRHGLASYRANYNINDLLHQQSASKNFTSNNSPSKPTKAPPTTENFLFNNFEFDLISLVNNLTSKNAQKNTILCDNGRTMFTFRNGILSGFDLYSNSNFRAARNFRIKKVDTYDVDLLAHNSDCQKFYQKTRNNIFLIGKNGIQVFADDKNLSFLRVIEIEMLTGPMDIQFLNCGNTKVWRKHAENANLNGMDLECGPDESMLETEYEFLVSGEFSGEIYQCYRNAVSKYSDEGVRMVYKKCQLLRVGEDKWVPYCALDDLGCRILSFAEINLFGNN